MITITGIVGTASDPRLADRLHHLEHDDCVETLVVGEEDSSRRRLRGTTSRLAVCTVLRLMAAMARARGELVNPSLRRSDLTAAE
jgi:hypothetical protein